MDVLALLDAFVAIADTGSVTGAAGEFIARRTSTLERVIRAPPEFAGKAGRLDDLHHGRLVGVLEGRTAPAGVLHGIHHGSRRGSAAVHAVLDHVTTALVPPVAGGTAAGLATAG